MPQWKDHEYAEYLELKARAEEDSDEMTPRRFSQLGHNEREEYFRSFSDLDQRRSAYQEILLGLGTNGHIAKEAFEMSMAESEKPELSDEQEEAFRREHNAARTFDEATEVLRKYGKLSESYQG